MPLQNILKNNLKLLENIKPSCSYVPGTDTNVTPEREVPIIPKSY